MATWAQFSDAVVTRIPCYGTLNDRGEAVGLTADNNFDRMPGRGGITPRRISTFLFRTIRSYISELGVTESQMAVFFPHFLNSFGSTILTVTRSAALFGHSRDDHRSNLR